MSVSESVRRVGIELSQTLVWTAKNSYRGSVGVKTTGFLVPYKVLQNFCNNANKHANKVDQLTSSPSSSSGKNTEESKKETCC